MTNYKYHNIFGLFSFEVIYIKSLIAVFSTWARWIAVHAAELQLILLTGAGARIQSSAWRATSWLLLLVLAVWTPRWEALHHQEREGKRPHSWLANFWPQFSQPLNRSKLNQTKPHTVYFCTKQFTFTVLSLARVHNFTCVNVNRKVEMRERACEESLLNWRKLCQLRNENANRGEITWSWVPRWVETETSCTFYRLAAHPLCDVPGWCEHIKMWLQDRDENLCWSHWANLTALGWLGLATKANTGSPFTTKNCFRTPRSCIVALLRCCSLLNISCW